MKKISRSRASILLGAPALAVAAPAAHAAIVYTPINGGTGVTLTAPYDSLFFNLQTGVYHPYGFTGNQILFTFYFGNPNNPVIEGLYGTDKSAYGGPASGVRPVVKFGHVQTVGISSSFSDATNSFNNVVPGNWAADGTHGYAGLSINPSITMYGWAEVSYNVDKTLTVYGFAVQTDGTAIVTPGTVPEPGTSAAMAALTAGSVAALSARRKRKLAKAA